MNSPAVTYEVAQRFHGLRRRFVLVRLLAILATASALLVACWIFLSVGDYYWEWSIGMRRFLFAGSVAATLVLLGTQVVSALLESNQRQFVGKLERRFDSLGQRLRTVLETAEGRLNAPTAMLTALGNQTLGRWETAAPAQVVPLRRAVCFSIACALLFVFGMLGLLFQNDWRTALLRSSGQDLPYTTLQVTPGDARLLEGSPLRLSLELHGRTDRQVTLRYRVDGSESWTESELLPKTTESDAELASTAANPRSASRLKQFEAGLGKLSSPMDYQFVTSAGATQLYRIDVRPLIEVIKFSAKVTPPAYTRLETRVFETNELIVLAGSDVEVTIETNHPLAIAQLEIGDKPSKLSPVEVHPSDVANRWTFKLSSFTALHWKFSGSGTDGTPMESVAGLLRVRRDEAPRIDWRDPYDEINVHMLAELPMRAQISDDYGLTEAAIVFQLGGEEEFVLKQWPPVDGEVVNDPWLSEDPLQVRLEEILPLESFALSERDFVAYYAYAIDNREGAEQRVESDVRYIDVRPLRQFYLEAEGEPNAPGANRSPIPELDEIIRRERFLINRTRKFVRSQAAVPWQQLATIETMVESQSELADLTRFMAEFLVSRGNDDTEALSQAEAAMLQAADSLGAANFPLALIQEDDALRALAEARQKTLEFSFIYNPTRQEMQALRDFRRQLRQKLRRETAKNDQQLADSLEQIAAEQKKLATEIQTLVAVAQSQKFKASDLIADSASSATSGAGSPNTITVTEPQEPDTTQVSAQGASQDPDTHEAEKATGKTAEEAVMEFLARQQDLLDRLKDIEAGLGANIKRSELVQGRMQSNIQSMDGLVGKLRENFIADVADPAFELADQLRELAMLIDALSQTEAANRVSAVRDMTTSLANMERESSNAIRQAVGASDSGAMAENLSKDSVQEGKSGADPGNIEKERARTTAVRLGRRIDQRAQTIEAILRAPFDSANLEAGEIADQIAKFVEDNQFLGDLLVSREAAQLEQPEKESVAWSDAAMHRAVEYADAATQLDQLYRQMVTPRIDLLRQLENRANQLGQSLAGLGVGENQSVGTPPAEQGRSGVGSIDIQRRELEQGLRAAGLEDLADVLNGQDEQERSSDMDTQDGIAGDPAFPGESTMTSDANRFSTNGNSRWYGAVPIVQRELRRHIQELILLEISADRNAPVPPQYRELVDRYFRKIAGEDVSVLKVIP